MTLYELDGQRVAVIGGELYLRIEPVGDEKPDEPVEAAPEPKARAGKPNTVKKRVGGKLGPEAKDAIRQELAAGATVADLADKYGVTTSAIYYTKKHGAGPRREPDAGFKTFQCKRGHRFQTNLPQQKAVCPDCREKVFREINEAPVEEGSILGKYESN